MDVLPAGFYDRDTVTVAKSLLGKVLRVRGGRVWRSGVIVEDEAYLRDDPANHAYGGQNRRNASMFKGPGTIYVYTIHGVNCVNIVTRRGEAVLLRAAEPVQNVSLPANGPGKLCKALGITRQKHDGLTSTGPEIQVLDLAFPVAEIGISRRVGVRRAKDMPLRFYVISSLYLSR